MEKLNIVLIAVVIILIGALGVSFGYMFFEKSNTTSNQTPMNITNVTNQTIPYSSEYITFSKAKSIAKSYAATGVVTSDPILVKAQNGDAIYYSTYSYNGVVIGGIILNAKTGAVLANQQNIPSQTNTQYVYTDTGSNYQDTSDQGTPDNSGDDGYSGDSGNSGDDGYSGDSGNSGDDGYYGDDGYSGDSGNSWDDGSYN